MHQALSVLDPGRQRETPRSLLLGVVGWFSDHPTTCLSVLAERSRDGEDQPDPA